MARAKVAIACQGGGSHAAFAAGVLRALLAPDTFSRFALVALSGTAGGAVCAALAWSGLISGAADPPAEAARRLTGFWQGLEADDAADAAANFWGVWLSRLPVVAEISPYVYEPVAEPALRKAQEPDRFRGTAGRHGAAAQALAVRRRDRNPRG